MTATTHTPPPPARRRRRRNQTVALLTILVTSVVAIGAVGAAWLFGWLLAEEPSAPQLSAQTLAECETVANAHGTWANHISELRAMAVATDRASAAVRVQKLADEGKAYYYAVDGFTDPASDALTVAVAKYNVDLGFLGLQLQGSSHVYPYSFIDRAVTASEGVDAAYVVFKNETCGGS